MVHAQRQGHAQGQGVDLKYRLSIAGRHNVKNSLAAASCALAAGVQPEAIVRGLQAFQPVKGRSRAGVVSVQGTVRTVVDDTYNANPDSVRAAIDVLAELPGPRLLVLGDMGEVGDQGPQFHAEAGRYAQARGIEHLMALGTLTQSSVAEFAQAQHFDSLEALNAAVIAAMPGVNSVLVKGSRFMRMERVVEALGAHYSNGAKAC
jgi:UDP-N-acetylmuramoyl-tripeptide--D-alanyl-D-alanine ligase